MPWAWDIEFGNQKRRHVGCQTSGRFSPRRPLRSFVYTVRWDTGGCDRPLNGLGTAGRSQRGQLRCPRRVLVETERGFEDGGNCSRVGQSLARFQARYVSEITTYGEAQAALG